MQLGEQLGGLKRVVLYITGGCMSRQETLLLQCNSCQSCLFTWSLPLIIINKYDDGISLQCLLESRRRHSTDTDIQTVVKRWYDVDMGNFLACFFFFFFA